MPTARSASSTLELLTAARNLASTVEAFTWGDPPGVASQLGDHGAATVYTIGDTDGLPVGPAGRGDRRCGRGEGRARGDLPRPDLRRPGHRRSALGPHSTRRFSPTSSGVSGDGHLTSRARHVRRGDDRQRQVHGRQAADLRGQAEVVRCPSRAAAAPARSSRSRPPTPVPPNAAKVDQAPRRGAHRAEARRGRGRRLRWPGARRQGEVRRWSRTWPSS